MDNAWTVVLSPGGRNAYLATLNPDGAIVIFDRNTATGMLTQKAGTAGCVSQTGTGGTCVDGRSLNGLLAVTVSPDGNNVYGIANNSEAVTIFDRDTSTGELTQKAGDDGCISNSGDSCADGTAIANPASITVSPDGKSVYVTATFSHVIAIFDRDTSNGKLTQKAGTAGCIGRNDVGGACTEGRALFNPNAAAVSPDNQHVYVATDATGVATFDRDVATGALTQKLGAAGCVVESEGVTAEVCADGNRIFDTNSLAVSPDGKNVYVTSGDDSALTIFDRDTSTGVITQKPGATGCFEKDGFYGCTDAKGLFGPEFVTISPDGTAVYVASSDSSVAVFDRDSVTGALTQKGGALACVSDTGNAGDCTDVRALNGPTSIAISPDNAYYYVTAFLDDAISVFGCTNCGDGSTLAGEVCDDANLDDGDGCTSDCSTVEAGFECPGAGGPCAPICGDGIVVGDEACDDNNMMTGDGCASDCSSVETGFDCPSTGGACEPICGDRMVVGDELCDDGNVSNSDSCLNDCTEASCGDGIVCTDIDTCTSGPGGGIEECDDDDVSNMDSCLTTCADATCGDGFLCADVATCTSGAAGGVEGCDDGNTVNDAVCLATCQAPGGDDDNDDLDNATENRGPNRGDSNGDGLLDST